MTKPKIYISGPISGRKIEFAERDFREAQQYLEARGYEVLNPFNNGLTIEDSWLRHMVADINMLGKADAVYMLCGWPDSDGAEIEFLLANRAGLPVYYQPGDNVVPYAG